MKSNRKTVLSVIVMLLLVFSCSCSQSNSTAGNSTVITSEENSLLPASFASVSLPEYTDMLRVDLLRLVTDIEDLCYVANGNKDKEEWSDETFSAFNKIKHKLLDKAGDIGRLPENMTEIKKESLSNFVARIINEGS